MNPTSFIRRLPPQAFRPLAALLTMAFALPAAALPTAPKVISGNVTISTAGDVMTIRNSPSSVINWNTFSIARPETVIFNQASASSRVFNRVTGNNPSELLGRMQSNGQVFLINPAGIYFGRDAKIETAGLVASTLAMTDADFMAGRMRFVGAPGAADVVNDGAIVTPTGGKVFLVGTNVRNRGAISTPRGETVLAAADAVEFADSSMPGVTVSLVTNANEVSNSGRVLAESGKIGLLGAAIRQQGTLSATGAVSEGGRIYLRASDVDAAAGSITSASGTNGGTIDIDATGTTLVAGRVETLGTSGTGGTVRLQGENVGLTGSAAIDASGVSGGGTVLVGGDYQGANAEIRNARFTYLGENTTIRADARVRGNGGKIVLWADDSTRAFGALSARGGSRGGNGGFAEVSGKVGLDYHARTDLRAPLGQDGLLLLDPGDITITAGDGLPGATLATPIFSTIGPGLTTLDWDDVALQLGLANVELRANAGGSIAFSGGTYASASPRQLTLLAEGSIAFTGANVELGGTLAAYAGWDGTSPASLPLLTNPGQTISLYSGRLKAGTINLAATGGITDTTTAGPLAVIEAQTLKAKTDTGDLYLPGANLVRFASLNIGSGPGDITFASSAPIVTVDAAAPNGNITLSSTAGDIGLKMLSAPTGVVDIAADGRIFDDNGRLTTNIEAGSLWLTSSGSNAPSFIAISADVVAPDIYAYVAPTAGYGGIDIRQNDAALVPTSVVLDDASTSAGYGSVRYASVGPITLDSTYSLTALSGRVSVQSGSGITIDSPTLSAASGAVDIHAAGSLAVTGGGLSATGTAVQIGAAGSVTVSGPVTVNSVVAGGVPVGHLSLASSSTLTVDSALSAPDGNITLSGSMVHVTTAGGTAGPGDAQNLTISGSNLLVEGSLQAQYNVNAITATDLTVAGGGTLAANGNVNIVAARNVIIDGSSLVADNEISIEMASSDSELRLNNGGVVAANQAGGAALIKLAFLGRSSGGILADSVPVVFTPGVANGFTNNGEVATPGFGMELLYGGAYNALTADLYGTFGDGSTLCHYRGGPCGGSYSPTAYADVSVEDSFSLFQDQAPTASGHFGGNEGGVTQPRSRKPGTCN